MNTYQITLDTTLGYGEDDYSKSIIAATSGKAKYELYRYLTHELSWEWYEGFKGFLQSIATCKRIHKFTASDLYGDEDMFERMKHYRDIEFAYFGMKVEVDGKKGVIVGSNSGLNLDICFDGQHWKENCHPWWRVKYFDNKGNLIKEYSD